MRGEVRPFDDPAATTRRRHGVPLRAALADDRRLRGAAGAARAAVPQHHAGAFLRALSARGVPHCRARPAGPGQRWSGTSTWRSATPSTTGRSSSASGSRRPACCRSRSTWSASPTRAAHPVLEQLLGDGLTNFLFVGRIVPNKRIEDIIRLAEVYKRYIDAELPVHLRRPDRRRCPATMRRSGRWWPSSRCCRSGSCSPAPVPDWELAAYYRTASVYLSLSEHEGFCVPLLEAMAADVPVFAYESSAVADTLGGAGVCWSPKDLEYAAELLGQLAFDPVMREQGDRRPAPASGGLQRGAGSSSGSADGAGAVPAELRHCVP